MNISLCLIIISTIIYRIKVIDGLVSGPNIVILLIDDLGWADIGFQGSQHLSTPNIDSLAADSIILNRYYTQPLCTPSRGALLTGIHPIHSGTQYNVIKAQQPTGLPTDLKLLPQYLKDYGYSTHAFGKWHLGFCRKQYTPTQRGFDSFTGFWSGYNDYFNHSTLAFGMKGYDFRKNFDPLYDSQGIYTTDYLTNETIKLINNHNVSEPLFLYMAYPNVHSGNPYDDRLQAPQKLVEKFNYIENEERRIFAANVYSLDQSIGKIFQKLNEKQMLENSIFVFISDNGGDLRGPYKNEASNYPLKGTKTSLWEGGVRVPAFIWSPLLKNTKYLFKQPIHVTDIMPTILEAIDKNSTKVLINKIDGISVWDSLSERKSINRNEILLNIDPVSNMSAIIANDLKLIQGLGKDFINNEDIRSPNYESPDSVNKNIINDRQSSVVFKILKNLKRSPDFNIFPKTSVDCRIESQNISKSCDSANNLCLYDLNSDPCEYTNIAEIYPDIVNKLWNKILSYNKTSVSPLFTIPVDPKANPIYHNNTWDIWIY